MPKIPPGNLAWITVVWVLLGSYYALESFWVGDSALGVGVSLFVVAGVLVWFDVRAVAWLLMAWFGIVAILAYRSSRSSAFCLQLP